VFYALDLECRIVVANETALRFVGLTPEQVIGRSHWSVVPEARGGPLEETFHQAYRTRRVVEVEVESSLHPGRFVRAIAVPLEDGLAITLRDITEQRESESARSQKLVSTEEHLRVAAEAAQIGTWEVDPQAGARYWSLQFRAILGVSEDTVADDQLFSSLIDSRDRDRMSMLNRGGSSPNTGFAKKASKPTSVLSTTWPPPSVFADESSTIFKAAIEGDPQRLQAPSPTAGRPLASARLNRSTNGGQSAFSAVSQLAVDRLIAILRRARARLS
jgi:PAS domain S-box-containing protein